MVMIRKIHPECHDGICNKDNLITHDSYSMRSTTCMAATWSKVSTIFCGVIKRKHKVIPQKDKKKTTHINPTIYFIQNL